MSLFAFGLSWWGHRVARRGRPGLAAGVWVAAAAAMVVTDGPLNGAITALLLWCMAGIVAVFCTRS